MTNKTMAKKNDDLLSRLLVTFRAEADEHLKAMSSGLSALGNAPAGQEQAVIVETMFRDAHSLKGAARAVRLTAIESVCQSLEDVFAALKGGRLGVSPTLLDLLEETIDALAGLVSADAFASSAQQPAVAALTRRLGDAVRGALPHAGGRASASRHAEASPKSDASAGSHAALVTTTPTAGAVRVSTAKLDAVMRQVEELLTPRLAAVQRASDLREAAAMLAVWQKQRLRIQPALRLLDRGDWFSGSTRVGPEIRKVLAYLDAEQLHLKALEDRLARLNQSAERDQRMLAGMSDGLLHAAKEMQLLPFASLVEVLPRFARELARDQDKYVELVIQGGEIEIDRRILEAMKDPFIHLLRNAIDHGIEKPAVREAKRKPAHGTITLAISQRDSGKVEVLMADDGAGIDAARVKAVAGKLGVVSAEDAERLGAQEAVALVFQSGVTTSPVVTDVSGRGLGLAIVRETVERLGGSVAIESQSDVGTAFRIVLPLTLANFRGVLVRAGGQLFVIPAANVERVARVSATDIQTVENRETILLDGQAVSVVWLSDVLELSHVGGAGQAEGGHVPVLVLGLGAARVAFRVEEVLGEQVVLVKTLGRQLARVRNVAGASVLGTGQVAPVLNVQDLVKSAVTRSAAPLVSEVQLPAEKPAVSGKQSILVVEDSITSRSLLKNILESAGYRVTTAVDGADGYATLKTGTFDLIVSDVEMPRMDGFALTVKVRADKELALLPVVLVTAMESREHRERGIDAGANAYVVKSSFDQSNLLEIVRRLI